jgi:predicted amidophosphoribosyltransferase
MVRRRPGPDRNHMTTCRFCAEDIQDAAVVCKHCGRELQGPPKAQVVTSPTSPLAWVGLFLILFMIAMGVIGTLAR